MYVYIYIPNKVNIRAKGAINRFNIRVHCNCIGLNMFHSYHHLSLRVGNVEYVPICMVLWLAKVL